MTLCIYAVFLGCPIIHAPVSGDGTFASGTQVTLTATANSGYTFDGWYENNAKVSGANMTYTFNATANRTLEARFILATSTTYTITATAGTGGTASGGGTFAKDTNVTLTATPNSGYNFDSWYEGSTRVSTSATYSFTATANRTLEARFTYVGTGGSRGGGGGTSYTSATLNIKEATFDKTEQEDIAITLSSGSYAFRDIKNGEYTLVRDKDYSVIGNSYTIKADYLKTLNDGKITLIFNMSGGANPSLVITIETGTPQKTDKNETSTISNGISINGKEIAIELNADGSVTLTAADLSGLVTPILLSLLFESGGITHTGVFKKGGQDIIIPFSVYKDSVMIMLVSEPGTYGVINNKKTFTDTNGHWAANTIDFITSRAIYSGVGNNIFDPDSGMTRAMFTQVLANIEGADLADYRNSLFADVENGAWYTEAVEWAADKGIVGGYGGGLFGPNDLITREQMAVMLNNYMNYKGIVLKKEDDYIPFADNGSISSWAKDAVTDMKRYGLIAGVGDNRYAPLDTANRASVAQIFRNFIEAYIK